MKHEPEQPRPDTGVLEALQVYRAAEAAMRRRTGAAMGIGENDLLALRLILDNTAAGRPTFAKDVSAYLGGPDTKLAFERGGA